MKLYRATSNPSDATTIPQWSCWTPDVDTARAYQDNPGFGGPHLIEIEATGDVLDLTGGLYPLAEMVLEAAADGQYDVWDGFADDWRPMTPDEIMRNWIVEGYPYYPWEHFTDICDVLVPSGYAWIAYIDDYPEGAITYARIAKKRRKLERKIQKSKKTS